MGASRQRRGSIRTTTNRLQLRRNVMPRRHIPPLPVIPLPLHLEAISDPRSAFVSQRLYIHIYTFVIILPYILHLSSTSKMSDDTRGFQHALHFQPRPLPCTVSFFSFSSSIFILAPFLILGLGLHTLLLFVFIVDEPTCVHLNANVNVWKRRTPSASLRTLYKPLLPQLYYMR